MTRWTEAELDLFKSKRQRGTQPKPALEFHLHCLLTDTLVRWCSPEWRYTHLPMGELRTPATAGRLKRMGVTAGWPDFIFIHKTGRVAWLELKRKGNDQTEAQEEKEQFLRHAGFDFLCTSSFDDALNYLKKLGVVLSTVTSWATGTTSNQNLRDAAPCADTTGDSAID